MASVGGGIREMLAPGSRAAGNLKVGCRLAFLSHLSGCLKRCALRIAAAAVAGGAAALILAGAPTLAGPAPTVGISKPAQGPEKPEQVLDHFLCYQVADHFPPAGLPAIPLMDQFGGWLDDLLIDDSLCNPVDKHPADGPDAHRKNNAAHLVCYLIWPP